MPSMARRRTKQLPANEIRGVYVDYLHRWAWYVDSRGRPSEYRMLATVEDQPAVEDELHRELDRIDPTPSGGFVPAPLHRLRLLP